MYPAFLVELFPYSQRTMGIGIEQIFGKLGGFFSTNVNPIALDAIDWKFFAIYCGWISFEFLTVFFLYPETYNRTLEELAFCKCSYYRTKIYAHVLTTVQCSKTRSLPRNRPRLPRNRSTRSTPRVARRTLLQSPSAMFERGWIRAPVETLEFLSSFRVGLCGHIVAGVTAHRYTGRTTSKL